MYVHTESVSTHGKSKFVDLLNRIYSHTSVDLKPAEYKTFHRPLPSSCFLGVTMLSP